MNKYTDWYDAEIKPVRNGLYQKEIAHTIFYSYWNNQYWGGIAVDAQVAFEKRNNISIFTFCKWRGLSEKAN